MSRSAAVPGTPAETVETAESIAAHGRACPRAGVVAGPITVAIAGVAALAGAPDHAAAEADRLRAPSSLTVCLVPLGDHEADLIPIVRRGIEHLYEVTVTQLDARALPKSAYYKPRRRYRAEKLLDYLTDHVVPGTDCDIAMGFTSRDISTTKGKRKDWGILGMAIIGGKAAVVSTFRVGRAGKVSRERRRTRTVKVANHELGHALGAPHYDGERGCVMNDAKGTVKTVDREHGLLCAPSRRVIERTRRIRLPEREAFDWDAVLGG